MTAEGQDAAPKPPKAPGRLAAPGRSLWRRITGDYELDARELVVLEAACRQADDIFRLEKLLDDQGMTVIGSQGQARLNPAFTELRQGRLALSKLLDALALPTEDDEEGVVGLTASARRAQKAALARHERDRLARERRAERFTGRRESLRVVDGAPET